MKKRYRRKRYKKRRSRLSASNWGPVLKLALFFTGILAGVALLTLIVLVLLEAVFHIDTPLPPDGIVAKVGKALAKEDILVVTPTPYISPEPTATPHPMTDYKPEEEEKEVVITPELQYRWFGDPSFINGKLLFSAGKIVGDNVRMCGLVMYDPASNSFSELPVKLRNAHFVYPCINNEWLVYLDAKTKGGGEICALKTERLDAEPIIIKTVYTGQPVLRLDGHYLSWIERTGTARDKLFVCDLETQETTVIAMFTNSSYGTSAPYMKDGTLIWAAESAEVYEDGRLASMIKHIELGGAGIKDYAVDTYVHNPQTNGKYFVWMDSHYGSGATLYYSGPAEGDRLTPHAIASGVVDYAIDEHFVAYTVDEVVYVYLFKSGRSFRITPERELAQLLGASEGRVIWMDVTTRETDVLKYAVIPSD